MKILSTKKEEAMMKVVIFQSMGMKVVEEMEENKSQKLRASLQAEVTALMAEMRAANSPSWRCLMFLIVGTYKRT